MKYLKLAVGEPVTVEYVKYVGPKQDDYMGKVTTKHTHELLLNGGIVMWDATELAHKSLEGIDVKQGDALTICKVNSRGKNYINVDFADDVRAVQNRGGYGSPHAVATVVSADEKEKRIVRQSTIGYAIQWLKGTEASMDEVYRLAEELQGYVFSGKVPHPDAIEESPAHPNVPDDLPF